MAEEWSECRGGDLGELYHARNRYLRQWVNIRRCSDQHCGDGVECGGDTDRESNSGGANDYDAAREPDGDDGTDGNVYGGGGRHGTTQVPVAEEWGKHHRGYSGELYDASNDHLGQRVYLRRGSNEHGGNVGEQCSDTDRKCSGGSADNHDATGKSDGDGGTDSDIHGDRGRDGTAKLPVAEEFGKYQWGYFR
jgi:hypothetical protein